MDVLQVLAALEGPAEGDLVRIFQIAADGQAAVSYTHLDVYKRQGLAWTVGKVRACPVLDVRYVALTHNTLRGAASGALLNAELLAVQGYIGN